MIGYLAGISLGAFFEIFKRRIKIPSHRDQLSKRLQTLRALVGRPQFVRKRRPLGYWHRESARRVLRWPPTPGWLDHRRPSNRRLARAQCRRRANDEGRR